MLWQVRRKQMANKDPGQERHRKWLDGPIDKKCYAYATPVSFELTKAGKVNL